jgi:hypothetical protein
VSNQSFELALRKPHARKERRHWVLNVMILCSQQNGSARKSAVPAIVAEKQFAQFTILCRLMGRDVASRRKHKIKEDRGVLICLPSTVNQITNYAC